MQPEADTPQRTVLWATAATEDAVGLVQKHAGLDESLEEELQQRQPVCLSRNLT